MQDSGQSADSWMVDLTDESRVETVLGEILQKHERIEEFTPKIEEVLRTENKMRTPILQGIDPMRLSEVS